MRNFDEIRDNPRISNIRPLPGVIGTYSADIYLPPFVGSVVFGFNESGMEHVSISHKRSSVLPSWDTMCKVKDIFFKEEEMAVQIHPPKSQYLHGVSDGKRKLENVRPVKTASITARRSGRFLAKSTTSSWRGTKKSQCCKNKNGSLKATLTT